MISSLRSKERSFQKEVTDKFFKPDLVPFFEVLFERDALLDRRVEAERVFELVFLDREEERDFRFCAIT